MLNKKNIENLIFLFEHYEKVHGNQQENIFLNYVIAT